MFFRLDTLADQALKKDDSGNTLYYPWGIFGSGFVLKSENTVKQIRKLYKIQMIYILINIPIMTVLVNVRANIFYWLVYLSIYLIAYYIWFHFAIKKITQGLQKTKEKIKISEIYSNQSKSISLPLLILFEILFIGATASIVWILLFYENAPPHFSFASIFFWLGLGATCFASIIYGYMLIMKVRNK